MRDLSMHKLFEFPETSRETGDDYASITVLSIVESCKAAQNPRGL